jgi:hypothetical protein
MIVVIEKFQDFEKQLFRYQEREAVKIDMKAWSSL